MKNIGSLKDYGHYSLDWLNDYGVGELKDNVMIEKCNESVL